MSKVKYYEIDSSERYIIVENFFNIVSELKTKREVTDFFLGLLTASEALMFSRRIQIAQMLLNGQTYEDIRNKIKASNQTITKTDIWLHGEDNKYNKWLKKCLEKKTSEKTNNSYKGMLDRYPAHRLLKNLLK